jgi:hypothetical protein
MGHSLETGENKNGDVLWIHGFMPLNCSDFACFLPHTSRPPTHPLIKPSGWMGHSLVAAENLKNRAGSREKTGLEVEK